MFPLKEGDAATSSGGTVIWLFFSSTRVQLHLVLPVLQSFIYLRLLIELQDHLGGKIPLRSSPLINLALSSPPLLNCVRTLRSSLLLGYSSHGFPKCKECKAEFSCQLLITYCLNIQKHFHTFSSTLFPKLVKKVQITILLHVNNDQKSQKVLIKTSYITDTFQTEPFGEHYFVQFKSKKIVSFQKHPLEILRSTVPCKKYHCKDLSVFSCETLSKKIQPLLHSLD